ncbi:MAG: hypothetical protein M3O70_20695, partial [Actinomycetota bacterium]|nr:hypothetical protein [Actinomycetota bacterium]
APYLGPIFGLVVTTRPIVEVVDHVLPGLVVLGIALLIILTGRLPLPAALLAVLASLWMAGTHIPLLLQARTGGVQLASALWHAAPGILLFALTVAATVLAWSEPAQRSRA